MTGLMTCRWDVRPSTPPHPLRHCGGCAKEQRFTSSGKIRLNANGRRLDAWLIYKCSICDRTWNRPILDRVPVSRVPPGEIDAMQHSTPSWVAMHEYDLAALRRFCGRIEQADTVRVAKPRRPEAPDVGAGILLCLHVLHPTGCRLDRLLAQALDLSRSQIQRWTKAGIIKSETGEPAASRRPVTSNLTLVLAVDQLQQADRAAVLDALWS